MNANVNVIVTIRHEGIVRKAIPVRAIPWATDFHVSPDRLAEDLSAPSSRMFRDSGRTIRLPDAKAYLLIEGGKVRAIRPKEWDAIVKTLHSIDEDLKESGLSREKDRREWVCRATEALPAGAFLWLDEFELAFSRGWESWPHPMKEGENGEYLSVEREGDREYAPYPMIRYGLEKAVLEGFEVMSQPRESQTEPATMALENAPGQEAAAPATPSEGRDQSRDKIIRALALALADAHPETLAEASLAESDVPASSGEPEPVDAPDTDGMLARQVRGQNTGQDAQGVAKPNDRDPRTLEVVVDVRGEQVTVRDDNDTSEILSRRQITGKGKTTWLLLVLFASRFGTVERSGHEVEKLNYAKNRENLGKALTKALGLRESPFIKGNANSIKFKSIRAENEGIDAMDRRRVRLDDDEATRWLADHG